MLRWVLLPRCDLLLKATDYNLIHLWRIFLNTLEREKIPSWNLSNLDYSMWQLRSNRIFQNQNMLFCLKSNEQKTKMNVAEYIIPWNTILRQMPYILFLLILCRFNTRRSRCLSLDNKAAFMRIAEFCSPALARSRYLNAVSTLSIIISQHALETIENYIREKHVFSYLIYLRYDSHWKEELV